MKRLFKYAIAFLVVIVLVPVITNAQTIKRQPSKTTTEKSSSKTPKKSSAKTEQTKKNTSKKSNKTAAKSNEVDSLKTRGGKSLKAETTPSTQSTASATRPADSYEPKAETFTVKGVTFDMIWVEGGTFMMGATSEQGTAWDDLKPVHQVTLSGYYIGRYEVTQELWQAVMDNNPSNFKGDARRPVECVSWEDCQEFLRRLNALTGKRFCLPTEAQWEFAARGGIRSRGYKYAGSDDLGSVAWNDRNSGSMTHPVGLKSPNELKLYDMSGNVAEWCQDWDGRYSSNPQTNPTGPSSGNFRRCRGGGWSPNGSSDCRVSVRYVQLPSSKNECVGLRLAL